MRRSTSLFTVVLAATAVMSAFAGEDPYRWLEEIEGEEALEWARAQSAETVELLSQRSEYETFRTEVRAILDSEERIPWVGIQGDHLYNFWQDADHERGIWRRTTLTSYLQEKPEWEVLLDVDALGEAEDESWVWKGASCLAPEYRHCMVALSRGGGDAVVFREFDTVETAFVEDGFRLPEAKSTVSWRDENSLWVGTDFGEGSLTSSGYPRVSKLWRRGTPLEAAETVFEGRRDDMSVTATSVHTPEGRYDMVVRRPEFFSGETFLRLGGRLVKLDLPDDADVRGIFKDHLLVSLRSPWDVGGRAYPQGALLAVDLDELLRGDRRFDVLFAPSERVSLSGVSWTSDAVLISTLDNVRGRLHALRPGAEEWTRSEIPVPGMGEPSIAAASRWRDFYFVAYQDFLTPRSLWLARGGDEPVQVKSEPAFFDAEGMRVEQYEATSVDGTKVPYFVVFPKGAERTGDNPTLLYAYGGFEISLTPFYSATYGATWLQRGGVLVVANIRGGGEFGPAWHRAALKQNRPRAFEDFEAVAEDLIERKITSPEHLGIRGGSNGGLLVGATMTRRPELYGAVVCLVPLLDMQRYNKLLAGASWMAEYGNPDIPEEWAFIRTWSPYHNVAADADYPQALFMTSTRDDRVHPGHARKMVAKLRAMGHPVLYYENTEGGHAAAADHGQRAKMTALQMTYLWMKLE